MGPVQTQAMVSLVVPILLTPLLILPLPHILLRIHTQRNRPPPYSPLHSISFRQRAYHQRQRCPI